MEPQPPSRSTPPPPPAAPPPETESGAASTSAPDSPAPDTAPPPNPEIVVCPVCQEPRAEDARFCEGCGHDFGGEAPPGPEERAWLSGPVLWVVMVIWAILAIAGLYFLYNALWSL